MNKALMLSCVVVGLYGCKQKAEAAPEQTPAVPVVQTAPAPPEKTPYEQVIERKSLAEAISFAQPKMTDTVSEVSPGAALLAAWATKNLTWADLEALEKTKFKLVMKDPDAERGKLLCGRGSIIEIEVAKTQAGKFYEGGMFANGYSDVLRFLAVKSTGELVANSVGRICGVVTGKYSYSNSGGGTTHGVYVVGMFDLPENRK